MTEKTAGRRRSHGLVSSSSPSLYFYNHLMTLSKPLLVAISHFSYYN